MTGLERVRRRTWRLIEQAQAGDRASRWFDGLMIALILLNVLAVILETLPGVAARFGTFFLWFEAISVAIFTLEYGLRLWCCTLEPAFSHPLWGRVRFALRPLSLVDLLAILPFYLNLAGIDLRILRILRVLRVIRVLKLTRYSKAMGLIGDVLRSRREELVLTSGVLLVLLVLSATLMYYAEHQAQPQAFPDIPTAMWWSVVTLTTVGYGDVYPITAQGRFLAAMLAVLGVGMVALPAGIIGSGFMEALQGRRERRMEARAAAVHEYCPHCGRPLAETIRSGDAPAGGRVAEITGDGHDA